MSLTFSTIVQTSWALDVLISTTTVPTWEIEQGINYLTKNNPKPPESIIYPTGAGLPGHFYIHYHSLQSDLAIVDVKSLSEKI